MKSIIATVALVTGTLCVPASAALNMALQIDSIKGESVLVKHEGWIDVLAWSWGLSNSGSIVAGGGGGAGKANFQDFSFTQYLDSSIVPIFLGVANGTHFKSATLDVMKAGGKASAEPYFKMIFSDVLLTSMSTGGSGGEDRLTANTSFTFGKVEMEYRQLNKDGSYDKPVKGGYDIKENKVAFVGDPAVMLGLFSAGGEVALDALAPTQPVPEPQTWALLLGGLAITGMAVRRRRRG